MKRTEHPKPQFERENWRCLNGPWEFEIDQGKSGLERGLAEKTAHLSQTIEVPFCPESRLSGIGYTDYMNAVWYKKTVTLSEKELEGRVFLHFGAVDYKASVFVNGKSVGTHEGGYVSFSFEITDFVSVGENVITLYAEDDTRSPFTPSGKQSRKYASFKCYYTRTTGIWQSVWLEFTPKTYIKKAKFYPSPESGSLTVEATLVGKGEFTLSASFQGKEMGKASVPAEGGTVHLTLPLKETHLWQVGEGNLYDLTLHYGTDRVKSYFGLRSVRIEGRNFLINGKKVFQRLVLDQGFYPDGIYTAPSDHDLIEDIRRSLAMGFNGARLHEKVFEERFLYHCDRLGYLVWGEFPSWGLDPSYPESIYGLLPEWTEAVERDFNHPAIIGWCPLNETWDEGGRKQFDPLLRLTYRTTKALDPTRPCIDTSGFFHVETDVYDVHNYTQDPQAFAQELSGLGNTNEFPFRLAFDSRQHYDGKLPFFVSEYGGIRWSSEESGWGYGNGPTTEEEFLSRLKGQTDALLDNPLMFGLCYTQLTDVEQEQNGLYTYDRKAKFPPEKIHPIFARKAAYEEE